MFTLTLITVVLCTILGAFLAVCRIIKPAPRGTDIIIFCTECECVLFDGHGKVYPMIVESVLCHKCFDKKYLTTIIETSLDTKKGDIHDN